VVNVSYFFSFVDDPTLTALREANVQRGATLLFAAAQFRKWVATGQLPYERVGGGTKNQPTPICATAYKYMFHACRIPHIEQDTYRIYDPSHYHHAIVARKGHFFAIPLVHPTSQQPWPVTDLEELLRQCILLADGAIIIPSSRPQLGLLTSQNRTAWAHARETLLRVGGLDMEQALERLQSGALLVTLDDEAPVSRQECGDLFWTGGLHSGSNRWFDKSIQLMVPNNGKAGLVAEHSMMDGMPVIRFADFITKMTYAEARRQSKALEPMPDRMMVVEDIFQTACNHVVNPMVLEELQRQGKDYPINGWIIGLIIGCGRL
jgi:carnitine O-acetyltransferase